MGLFSSVRMALQGEFSPVFLHILLIILKSKSSVVESVQPTDFCAYRIILATIRYLGGCPCPRCFIKKDQINALGTKVDDQRRSHLRTDTEHRQHQVNKTRSWIFDKGRGVNSTWVEDLLQADSWVPTRVRAFIIFFFIYLLTFNRMPFHQSYFNSGSIFFPWWSPTSFMNLSLESGKQFLPISYECCMLLVGTVFKL